jgi:hypothetical protein
MSMATMEMSAQSNRPSPAPTGYVRISREIADHPIVGFGQPVKPADPERGSYSRGEAWLFLVFQARWKTAEVSNRGKVIVLERGELLGARAWLAKVWNWNENTVRGFLDKLEVEMMIDRKSHQSNPQSGNQTNGQKIAHFTNVLIIRNYSIYQHAIERFCEEKDQSEASDFTRPSTIKTTNHPPHIKEGKEKIRSTTLGGLNLGLAPLRNSAQSQAPEEQQDLFWDGETVKVCNGARAPLEHLIGDAATLDDILTQVSPKLPDKPTGRALLIAVTAAVVEHTRDLTRSRQKRGTRLPRDWKLPKSWGEWTMGETSLPDSWVRGEAAKFRDYWIAQPGVKGTKLDWEATWRNWVRAAGRPMVRTAIRSADSSDGIAETREPWQIRKDEEHDNRAKWKAAVKSFDWSKSRDA